MKNDLEMSKMIVLTALRYLFDKNNMNFNDIFDENKYIQEFVQKIDYCNSIVEVKNTIKEYQANDLEKWLKSKEFYQLMKKVGFTEENINVLKELIK